jgi:hypothetical protein
MKYRISVCVSTELQSDVRVCVCVCIISEAETRY